MNKTKPLYKVLNADGTPCNGGKGKWYLPKGKSPGKWMPPIKALVPCQSGYHLCREQDLVFWLGPVIWEAEYRGKMIKDDNKIVVEQARLLRKVKRWNEKNARLFACDCAGRVLGSFEKQYPQDDRPRKAIEVARKYAIAKATQEELSAASSCAASCAAFSAADRAACRAAFSAACSAAYSASRSAAYSAAYSAYSASYSAACSAAYSAANSDERQWQTKKLMEYLKEADDEQQT